MQYKLKQRFKNYKIIELFFLVSLFLLQAFIFSVKPAQAATNTWNFTTPSNYTYDSDKIEISAGQAQLKAASSWYSTSWGFRKSITIDNTGNASALTNYQVQVSVTYDSDMQADFDDVRFTDSDSTTLIDHWLETKTDSTQATFWVEIPSIDASSSKTIYMYYGNASASSGSSGLNTLPVFDDFESYFSTKNTAYTASSNNVYEPDTVKLSNGDILMVYQSTELNGSAGTDARVLKSTDDGDSFSNLSNVTNTAGVQEVAPTIALLTGGDLIVLYADTSNNKMYIKRSSDSGETWGSAVEVKSGSRGESAILELSSGRILAQWQNASTLNSSYSDDGGDTWSSSATVYTCSGGCEGNSLIQLTNGDILSSVEDELSEGGESNIIQRKSDDNGESWGSTSTLWSGSSGYDIEEGEYVSISDSEIWFITSTDERSITKNSYASAYIVRKKSTDNGSSWSDWKQLSLHKHAVDVVSILNDNGELLSISSNYPTADRFWSYRKDYTDLGDSNGWYTDTIEGARNTFDLQTDTVYEGTNAVESAANPAYLWRNFTSFNSGQKEFNLWVRPSSASSVSHVFYIRQDTAGGNQAVAIRFNSNGKLNYNTGGTWTDSSVSFGANEWWKWRIVVNMDTSRYSWYATKSGEAEQTVVEDASFRNAPTSLAYLELYTEAAKSYADLVWVREYSSPDPSSSANSEETLYVTDNPTVNPTSGNSQSFTALSGFSESATKNGGAIKYQISNDQGTSWYWYNSGWATTSSGYTETNTASEVDSNIADLPAGSGEFLFKAYLNSNGGQLVQLDSVTLTYSSDTTAPSISLTPISPDPTSSNKPSITGTATDAEATVSNVQFQVDTTSGSWSDCVADDGTFDEASEAFTCTVSTALSNGSHVMYVRATDSNSNTTSDANAETDNFSVSVSSGSSSESTETTSNDSNDNDNANSSTSTDTSSSSKKKKSSSSSSSKSDSDTTASSTVGSSAGTFSGALQTSVIEQDEIPKTTEEEMHEMTAGCETYVVKAGDSLMKIAKEQLGSALKYDEIIELSQYKYPDIKTNQGYLKVGWELVVSCPQEIEQKIKTEEQARTSPTYKVKVLVVDKDKNPIPNTKVTLFSTPRETMTDDNGIASFENVEKGEHRIVIAYKDQKGEEKINLEGDTIKEFNFTVQIEPENIFHSPIVISIIIISILTIGGLLFWIRRITKAKV